MNKKQAAEYCKISTETLDRYKDRGKLGFVRIGKRCLWTEALLDEFISSCTIQPVTPTTEREKSAMAKATGGAA
jgi:excisionase family DNA binding protein